MIAARGCRRRWPRSQPGAARHGRPSLLAARGPGQDFPSRPVRMVVPFGAGTTTDIVARVVAEGLAKPLGQTVVVENRAGAGGNIGSDLVAKATPTATPC